MPVRVICLFLIFLYIFIQFTYIGYYIIAHSLLSLNMMLALAQTNLSEAMEYVRVNIPYAGLAAAVAALFCLGWLLFRMSRMSFIRMRPPRGRSASSCSACSSETAALQPCLPRRRSSPMW